jgi:hypothetical protein
MEEKYSHLEFRRMYTVRRGMHGINHSWTVCTQFELLRNSRKGCGTVTVGSLHSWVSDVGCSDSIIRGLCASACTSEAFIRGCQTWDVPIQSFVDYVRRQAVGSGSSCVDSGTCGGPPLFSWTMCVGKQLGLGLRVWTRVPAEGRHFLSSPPSIKLESLWD